MTVHRNLYGRRQGHNLKPSRKRLLDDRLEAIQILGPKPWPDQIDLAARFGRDAPNWLEIGFGGGEHLAAMAAANPHVDIIGCEHYLPGVASCVRHLDEADTSNALLHHGDARDLMDLLPDGSIERVFLLYPDPWPKTRHHKRRFVNTENLESAARIMSAGAELRVASDIPDYILWSQKQLAERTEFEPVHRNAEDIATSWDGWPSTRYEQKALREGRTPGYLTFRRR